MNIPQSKLQGERWTRTATIIATPVLESPYRNDLSEKRRREWAREGKATVKLIDAFLKRLHAKRPVQPEDFRTVFDPLAARNLSNAQLPGCVHRGHHSREAHKRDCQPRINRAFRAMRKQRKEATA